MIYTSKNKACLFISFILLLISSGCKEQDEMYRQYVPEGGIIYPCKAENALTKPGIGKVYISWPNTTSTVTKAGIWWNNYEDSVMVDITAQMDTVSVSIDIDEGIYSFFIKTFDKSGNVSIPVEVIGRSIGDKYMSGFHHRTIKNYKTKGKNSLIIEWDKADDAKGAIYNEIVYTSTDDTEKMCRVPVTEMTTEITDHKTGTVFKYNTAYQPDRSNEFVVATAFREISNAYLLLVKSIGSVIDKSNTWPDPSCLEAGAYDGNYNNRWHSQNSGYPHFITIDLGAIVSIERLVIWPSYFDGKPDRRMPSRIEWEVSTDNVTWTNLGEYTYEYDASETNWDPREYTIPQTNARYLKLRGLDDPSGSGIMCLGEIDVYSAIGK